MDMKKISCTVLIVAASMTSVALASRDVLAPAPAPAGEASGASAAVGSLVGASVLSLFALCFHISSSFYLPTMDMKKISCTVLIVAASMTSIALASRDVLAPAPAPAGESSGASAAVGSLVGASVLSLFALCFH
ncbi:hypothetical protein JRO89_XS10G0042800 [Xanthoceras sorbifolium]|uniref:Uncharacterized protein n=1 Tax=Xanthoceras sorbifolium TaxID=99658 RepID=A0ABQ8HHK5_9ROSI|nr:hypothetical protein JRO89_XS10G0042800 [Xanthoceras sorbifolium]